MALFVVVTSEPYGGGTAGRLRVFKDLGPAEQYRDMHAVYGIGTHIIPTRTTPPSNLQVRAYIYVVVTEEPFGGDIKIFLYPGPAQRYATQLSNEEDLDTMVLSQRVY